MSKIGLASECYKLANWVSDRHMQPLDLAELHKYLNQNKPFVEKNLWLYHRYLYHELARKIMSSHNVLHGYRDVAETTKPLAKVIFEKMAKFNNKAHNLILRYNQVISIRNEMGLEPKLKFHMLQK